MTYTKQEILDGLALLEPSIPWAHHFDLGHGIETVSRENQQFYKKAIGLKKLIDILTAIVPYYSRRQQLRGMRVLDIASAEGMHSIALAKLGATVTGIEGRQLYVNRANFVRNVLGVENVEFFLGDVRKFDSSQYGQFDLVLCSGILHHLGPCDFDDMIELLHRITGDMLFLYLHISNDLSIARHNLQGLTSNSGGCGWAERIFNRFRNKPRKAVATAKGYKGYLYREHEDSATNEEKVRQVRASLDNTFSFWPTEPSLYNALGNAGFKSISRLQHPHLFGWEESSYRPLVIARV